MRESARQFPVMAHLASSARPRLGRDALRTRPTSPTPQRLARVAREGGFSAIHRDGPRRGDARDASRRAPFARRVRALRASFSRGALRRRARVSRGGRRRRRRARRRRRVLPVLPRRVTDRPRPRGAPSPSADPDPALDRAAGDASTSASTAAAAARPASASPPRRVVSHVSQFAAGMREGGHDITSFALEVTLPPALPARQAATRAHLAGVRSRVAPTSDCSASDDSSSGDGTAQDATTTTLPQIPQTVEIKDVFRALILPALESRDARHDQAADFRFALLFEHDASATEAAEAYRDVAAADAANTRHKRKTPPAHLNVAVMPESPAGLWQSHGAAYNAAERRAERVRTSASTELRPKPSPPRDLAMHVSHADVASARVRGRSVFEVGARGAAVAVVRGRRRGRRGSVQASLDAVVSSRMRADGCKLNSAGREDMDVRMLGGGRPFILEVHNPRSPVVSAEALAEMEAALESADDGVVTATGLHVSDREAYRGMHEGSEEKEKAYTAVCWASRPLAPEDLARLSAMRDVVVHQQTPVRVLHRRSPAVRPRTVRRVTAEGVPGAPRFFTLTLRTQAGTYIKEFVHGDFGRTRPNVGELLGCRADILQLDVTDIEMAFAGGGEEARRERDDDDEKPTAKAARND